MEGNVFPQLFFDISCQKIQSANYFGRIISSLRKRLIGCYLDFLYVRVLMALRVFVKLKINENVLFEFSISKSPLGSCVISLSMVFVKLLAKKPTVGHVQPMSQGKEKTISMNSKWNKKSRQNGVQICEIAPQVGRYLIVVFTLSKGSIQNTLLFVFNVLCSQIRFFVPFRINESDFRVSMLLFVLHLLTIMIIFVVTH